MTLQSQFLPLFLSSLCLALSFTFWTAPSLFAETEHPTTTVRKDNLQARPTASTKVGDDDQASSPLSAANTDVTSKGSLVRPKPSTSSVRKPILIFHAGPMKTGSTSIQMFFQNAEKTRTLTQDNFVLIGNGRHILKPMCFRSECTEEEFVAFDRRMEELRLQGQNIILSSEDFAAIASKKATIKRSFDRIAENWDLRVVIVYRPFYDWLPSLYAQAFKTRILNSRGSVFRNLDWHNKNSIMKPFADWAEEHFLCHLRYTDGNDPLFPKCQDSLTTFLKFKALLQGRGRLVVVNMYQDGDLVQNIIKASAPEAKKSNELAQSKNWAKLNLSGEFEFDFHADEIVAEAFRRGIVTVETPRIGIRAEVKTRLEGLGTDLPRVCMNEEQKNLAWVHTKRSYEILNGVENPTIYNDMIARFQKAASTKLCSIDTARVLDDPEWVAFIKERAANISAFG